MKHAADAILHTDQAQYLDAVLPSRDAILIEMESFALANGNPISDPEVAAFMSIVVRARRPKRIVEIGTNIGYGSIVLARANPESKVVTIELSPEICAIARGYIARAGLAERVEVRQGAALAELEKIELSTGERGVDLFYVDCVKEEYPQYLEKILPRLASHGVILADNVLWQGLVAKDHLGLDVPADQKKRVAGLRAFNRALLENRTLESVILPLGDGVAFATKI